MPTPETPICDYEGSDYQASFWEQGGRDYEDRVEAIALKRLLPGGAGMLLELGAGAGRNTVRYRGFERIVLLDFSRTQLQEAQSRLGRSTRYTYVAADVYRLPFVQGLFDAATMIRVLHHMADAPRALRGVHDILKTDAVFILEFVKVLCEQAVAQHYSEALVIRPTYVVGPHDYTHRFTYWVNRIAGGRRVVAPDLGDYGIQVIDGRDQARWILELLERGESGTFHTVSPPPPFTFAQMLQTIVDAVGPDGTEIVPVDPAFLIEHSVGGSDLPLWYPSPEPDPGLNCSPARAVSHGFETRTLTDTVRETLAHEQVTPTPNPDGTGWSREREAEVLAAWDAR